MVVAVFCLTANRAEAETLNWTYPGANTNVLNTSSATTINGVTVTTSAAASGGFSSNNSTILFNTSSNGSAAGILEIRMDASSDLGTSVQTATISFSEPVYNLTFIVRDIDGGPTYAGQWNDTVKFTSDNGFPAGVTAPGVNYNAATGTATSISNGNTTGTNGNISVTYPGPVTTISVAHMAADTSNPEDDPAGQVIYIDDLTFLRSPRLAVQKSYTGGSGSNTFNFDISNSGTGTTATSVTTSGAAVTGTVIRLNQTNVLTTVTETGPTGWIISPASSTCSDSNSANSGNPATFAAGVVGYVVSVPATNIRAGAVITCPIVNAKRPTLQIRKITLNGIGTFGFSGGNGYVAENLTTVAASTAVAGAVQTLAAAAISTTITEGIPDSGWQANSATCTGTAAGNVTYDTATRQLALNTTATAANNNLVCTFTNTDVAPRLTMAKVVTNDNGGTAAASAFSLSASGPTPLSGTSGSTAVTSQRVLAGVYGLSETGPTGYLASAWVCPGETLSGSNVTLSNSETRTCTITNNDIAPTLQLRKISNGGVSTFNFTGTNGFGSDAINTTAAGAGNPQNGVVKPLSSVAQTDITEAATSGYFLSGAPVCTGMGSGGSVTLVSGQTYRLNAAALPIGSTVVCTFVNTLATPQLTVAKSTPTVSVNAAGQSITYTVAVSNPGNVPVTGITVSDPLGTVTCTTSGNATIATLAPTASENCTLVYAVQQADLNNNGGGDGDIDNTASAAGTYSGTPVSNSGSTTVALVRNPQVGIAKSWAFAPGGDVNGNGTADLNDVIRYTYAVTNNGNLTLNGIGVADIHEGAALPPGLIINETLNVGGSPSSTDATPNDGIWSVLQPGDTVQFRYQHTVTQTEINNG